MVSVAESRGATSGYTALLIAVAPLAIVVFRRWSATVPRALTLLGVLTGFGGLALLVARGRDGGDVIPLGPALLVLLRRHLLGARLLHPAAAVAPGDPFVIAVYEMVLGGIMMRRPGWRSARSSPSTTPSRTWVALGYLVVFGSVVAFSAYVWLVANAPISLVATYAYVNPVVAVLLGWLVLDETDLHDDVRRRRCRGRVGGDRDQLRTAAGAARGAALTERADGAQPMSSPRCWVIPRPRFTGVFQRNSPSGVGPPAAQEETSSLIRRKPPEPRS